MNSYLPHSPFSGRVNVAKYTSIRINRHDQKEEEMSGNVGM